MNLSGPVLLLLLSWAIILLGSWLAYRLFLQHGRLLLRVEQLEAQLTKLREPEDGWVAGLPLGTVLHDFDLPQLTGGRMTRSQWLGRRLLLIFLSPSCPASRVMLTRLATLPAERL